MNQVKYCINNKLLEFILKEWANKDSPLYGGFNKIISIDSNYIDNLKKIGYDEKKIKAIV
jgi:hypothetical protein